MADRSLDVLPEPSPTHRRMERLGQWLSRAPFYRKATALYTAHPHWAPAVFFFGGVAWDAATLRRIDNLFDLSFLLAYLLALGALIVAAEFVEQGRIEAAWLVKRRDWIPAGIQFFLGALFSAYVVYYLQSASLSETSFYLGFLLVLLVSNEFIHRRLVNLYLLIALYFLASFSFFIFFVPVVAKQIGFWTFLSGGVLSVAFVLGMLEFMRRKRIFKRRGQYPLAVGIVLALFGMLNFLYVSNMIPPAPLAMREGGIFHHVSRAWTNGPVQLTYERPPWYKPWVRSDRVFRYRQGEPVYCFAAVFAPTALKGTIVHAWQYWDDTLGVWQTADALAYSLEGGRDGGWRWWTRKRRLHPGRWRVDVQTEDGHTIGRIPFRVEAASEAPTELATRLYE